MSETTKLTDFLPFEVAPRATFTSFIYAESACAPTGIVIPDDIASDFWITDIKVGPNSQIFSAGALPASIFAARSKEILCSFDPLREGDRFALTGTNQTDSPKIWKADVKGHERPDISGSNFLFGLGIQSCPPGGVLDITMQPQIACSLSRLVIPSHINKSLVVKGISLASMDGHSLTTPVSRDVPAAQYDESEEGLLDTISIIKTWHAVKLSIMNTTDSVVVFTGAFVGLKLPVVNNSAIAIGAHACSSSLFSSRG